MNNVIDKPKKVILFYNPASGNGMFKNNLDYIIGRYQDAGFQLIPIRAAHGHAIYDYLSELNQETYQDEYHHLLQ